MMDPSDRVSISLCFSRFLLILRFFPLVSDRWLLMMQGSESEDISGKNSGGVSSEESIVNEQNKKTCADCGTSKTPLWRGGPAGPKVI